MRQIDNMNQAELDMLHLKGMLSYPKSAQPQGSKAQNPAKPSAKQEHSPLPWRIDFNKYDQQFRVYSVNAPVTNSMFHADNDADAKLIVASVNGYTQAIEACRLAQAVIGGADTSGAGQRAAHAALFVALANWEEANK